MIRRLPLALQTTYADLLDRARDDALRDLGPQDGAFLRKVIKGRPYWYLQTTGPDGRRVQRYVGPETPELVRSIERRREASRGLRDRKALVRALVRAGLPAPPASVGKVIAALAG